MRSAQSCVRDALFACVMHAIGGSRMNFVAAAATKFIPHASSCPELTVPGFELASSSWYRVAVASTSRDGDWLRDRQQWTAEDARVFAEGAQCVALGVYDGESYLLWRAE